MNQTFNDPLPHFKCPRCGIYVYGSGHACLKEPIMTEDGVALQSAEHPLHPEHVKAVAIAICIADKVNPFAQGAGLGDRMPEGVIYELWEARKAQAEAAIKASSEWFAAQPQDVSTEAIEKIEMVRMVRAPMPPFTMIEIEVRDGETLHDAILRSGKMPL